MTAKYFALVSIDGGYVLVPSDTDANAEIHHNFCHKQDFSRTCTVEQIYDAEMFTKWVKAYWFKTTCGDGEKGIALVESSRPRTSVARSNRCCASTARTTTAR